MRILLTNDDSIHDEGFEVLERIARTLSDDIWMVAPQTDQSGVAHALTLNHPLRVRKYDDRRFAVDGTPTDCVIMAVRQLMPEPPDLVLSGVNSGMNIGDFVNYSGTVAGAMEGMLLGIKSIALSQGYDFDGDRVVPWKTAETHAPAILRQLIDTDLPKDTFLNVNFPSCEASEVKGCKVATQGKFVHSLHIEQRVDGRSFPYYWMRFKGKEPVHQNGSDIHALAENMIAVTPLKSDLTDRDFFGQLENDMSKVVL